MNKIILFIVFLLTMGCSKRQDKNTPFILSESCDESSALSTCLTPKFSPEYYIEQGVKYFLTMQSDIPDSVQPFYSDRVIRWEWKPWLLLTGFTRKGLIETDILLKLNPTAYDTIDCRYFDQQPFCRCHVVFNYSGETCPIYEEFTYNDQGEITFIEAWSDFESLLPMGPGTDGFWDYEDYWGMGEVNRLSTRVPGLGNETGKIDLDSEAMSVAAQHDEVLNDMVKRAKDPVNTWIDQLINNFDELNSGCEPPEGDEFPYYTP